jgi:hypothetical protein
MGGVIIPRGRADKCREFSGYGIVNLLAPKFFNFFSTPVYKM